MSAESSEYYKDQNPRSNVNIVSSTEVTDPSILESVADTVAGFISDVVPSSYTTPHDTSDQIQWAHLEPLECDELESASKTKCEKSLTQPLILVLGYKTGIQVWSVSANGLAAELVPWRPGKTKVLRILPSPYKVGANCEDLFSSKRPLMALSDFDPAANSSVYILEFLSLKTMKQVKSIKFRNQILDVQANRRSVVVSFSEKIVVLDAFTLRDRCTVVISPVNQTSPIALGLRWLAYTEKTLVSTRKSGGGCDSEGVQSYTATMLECAKYIGKGIKEFSESVANSFTGNANFKPGAVCPGSPQSTGKLDGSQKGVVTVLDIECDQVISREPLLNGEGVIAHFIAHNDPVASLKFDPSGMLLLTADVKGYDFHVFRIHPHPVGATLASVHHLYILHRGDTTARVQDMCFSPDSRWVTVSTRRGTTHVFPITPYGGNVSVRTHTTPIVVNKMSRYHRSAGLTGENRSNSPVSGSDYTTKIFPHANPRFPPFPHPTIINALAQIKQPSSIQTSGTVQLRSTNIIYPEDSICIEACFAPPRAYIDTQTSQKNNSKEPKPIDSLFIIAYHGCLIQYDLEPCAAHNVLKERICDDSPIQLKTIPTAQWRLQRTATSTDPQKHTKESYFEDIFSGVTKKEVAEQSADYWLSQVELTTHAGPHRRLWMGPQFTFKTYTTTAGNPFSLMNAQNIEIGRINPANLPVAQVTAIESDTQINRDLTPSLNTYQNISDEIEVVGDLRLEENLADALKESSVSADGVKGMSTSVIQNPPAALSQSSGSGEIGMSTSVIEYPPEALSQSPGSGDVVLSSFEVLGEGRPRRDSELSDFEVIESANLGNINQAQVLRRYSGDVVMEVPQFRNDLKDPQLQTSLRNAAERLVRKSLSDALMEYPNNSEASGLDISAELREIEEIKKKEKVGNREELQASVMVVRTRDDDMPVLRVDEAYEQEQLEEFKRELAREEKLRKEKEDESKNAVDLGHLEKSLKEVELKQRMNAKELLEASIMVFRPGDYDDMPVLRVDEAYEQQQLEEFRRELAREEKLREKTQEESRIEEKLGKIEESLKEMGLEQQPMNAKELEASIMVIKPGDDDMPVLRVDEAYEQEQLEEFRRELAREQELRRELEEESKTATLLRNLEKSINEAELKQQNTSAIPTVQERSEQFKRKLALEEYLKKEKEERLKRAEGSRNIEKSLNMDLKQQPVLRLDEANEQEELEEFRRKLAKEEKLRKEEEEESKRKAELRNTEKSLKKVQFKLYPKPTVQERNEHLERKLALQEYLRKEEEKQLKREAQLRNKEKSLNEVELKQQTYVQEQLEVFRRQLAREEKFRKKMEEDAKTAAELRNLEISLKEVQLEEQSLNAEDLEASIVVIKPGDDEMQVLRVDEAYEQEQLEEFRRKLAREEKFKKDKDDQSKTEVGLRNSGKSQKKVQFKEDLMNAEDLEASIVVIKPGDEMLPVDEAYEQEQMEEFRRELARDEKLRKQKEDEAKRTEILRKIKKSLEEKELDKKRLEESKRQAGIKIKNFTSSLTSQQKVQFLENFFFAPSEEGGRTVIVSMKPHATPVAKVVNPLGKVVTIQSDGEVEKEQCEDAVIHENCDEDLFRPIVAPKPVLCSEGKPRLNSSENMIVRSLDDTTEVTVKILDKNIHSSALNEVPTYSTEKIYNDISLIHKTKQHAREKMNYQTDMQTKSGDMAEMGISNSYPSPFVPESKHEISILDDMPPLENIDGALIFEESRDDLKDDFDFPYLDDRIDVDKELEFKTDMFEDASDYCDNLIYKNEENALSDTLKNSKGDVISEDKVVSTKTRKPKTKLGVRIPNKHFPSKNEETDVWAPKNSWNAVTNTKPKENNLDLSEKENCELLDLSDEKSTKKSYTSAVKNVKLIHIETPADEEAAIEIVEPLLPEYRKNTWYPNILEKSSDDEKNIEVSPGETTESDDSGKLLENNITEDFTTSQCVIQTVSKTNKKKSKKKRK